jgi:hypothetical protein
LSLSRRIVKLETARKPIVRVPHVIHVRRGETTDEARDRFAAAHPAMPRGHAVLIVPARDRTAADDADFDTRFHAQQTTLIANAKSERRKGTDECLDNR